MHPLLLNWNLLGSPSPGNIRINGEVVGNIKWAQCDRPSFLNFDQIPGGFEFYRQQMKEPIFPMVYIECLEIDSVHRGKGYADAALLTVLRREKRKGAKSAFVRVGFFESEGRTVQQNRDSNIRLYQRVGFEMLHNKPDGIAFPLMWHPLNEILAPSLPIKVLAPIVSNPHSVAIGTTV